MGGGRVGLPLCELVYGGIYWLNSDIYIYIIEIYKKFLLSIGPLWKQRSINSLAIRPFSNIQIMFQRKKNLTYLTDFKHNHMIFTCQVFEIIY